MVLGRKLFFIYWAIMAISLFNTVLLLWLGLTILLNAERRTWGVWLSGVGVLMGGVFFISHSAILGHGLTYVSRGMDFWWHVGWVPVVGSPFAWYVAMLWYAGFWGAGDTPLRRRHRIWFALLVLVAAGAVGLLVFANPLPSYSQVAQLKLSATPSVGGIPLLILVYPAYIVLCIGLSMDALRNPGPSARVMGDIARRRARPWLVATSGVLLLVSLLVAWVMLWIVLNARQRELGIHEGLAWVVTWFDLVISLLIAASVILLGQAIVSYEVFTGKTLPRRGFFRHWRSVLILAAGYGVVVGWALVSGLRPVYSLLATTVLMTAFFGLFSWRSYADRERYIEHLRPFVASQRLYEHLLTPSAPPEVDASTPFRALCEDVLGARAAYLAAIGPLAPLVGPALAYPAGETVSLPPPGELASWFDSPQTMCLPVDPARCGGASWAVPLWSERGLIGVLLLGEKRDGGLYTQEEMEIARAVGERLIDTRASAEMARRLMSLQRERLAESRLLDRQTRRVLHDDVLPQLHAVMLTLDGDPSDALSLLGDAHRQISDLLRDMPTAAAPEVARLGLIRAIEETIGEMADSFDGVSLEIEPGAERECRSLPDTTAEVLFYAAREAIRNAARHGRRGDPSRPLHLRVRAALRGGPEILVEDDGAGIAEDVGGDGGRGLALHGTMMAIIGGALSVESAPGKYTRVLLTLPRSSP